MSTSDKDYHRQYCRAYYYENKDEILAKQKERRQDWAYREKMKKYYREYYRKNKTKILEQSRHRRYNPRPKDAKPEDFIVKITYGKFTISFD